MLKDGKRRVGGNDLEVRAVSKSAVESHWMKKMCSSEKKGSGWECVTTLKMRA